MTFTSALIEALALAAGRPMTPAEKERARRLILVDEHRMKLAAFRQQMQADAEAMKCGPLRVEDQ